MEDDDELAFSGKISDYIDQLDLSENKLMKGPKRGSIGNRSVSQKSFDSNCSVDSLDYALRTLKQASVLTRTNSGPPALVKFHNFPGDGPLNMSAFDGDSESERSLHSRSHSPEGVGSFELTGPVELQNKKLHRRVNSLQRELDLMSRKLLSEKKEVEDVKLLNADSLLDEESDTAALDAKYIDFADNLFKLSEELEFRRKAQEEEQKKLESEIVELEKQKKKVQTEWATLQDTSMMIEFRKKQYDHKMKKFKEMIEFSKEHMRNSKREIDAYVKQQWYRLKKMTREFEEKLVNKIKAKKDVFRKEASDEREKLAAEFEMKRDTLLQGIQKREDQVEEQARKNTESQQRIKKLKEELKNVEHRIKESVEEERRKVAAEKRELHKLRLELDMRDSSLNASQQAERYKMELAEVKNSMEQFQNEMVRQFVKYFDSAKKDINAKIKNADCMHNEMKGSIRDVSDFDSMENSFESMEGSDIQKEREKLRRERAIFERERRHFFQVQQFFEKDADMGSLVERITRLKVEKEQFDKDKEKLKHQTLELEQILLEKQQQFEQAQANWQTTLRSERATINRLKKELVRVSTNRNKVVTA